MACPEEVLTLEQVVAGWLARLPEKRRLAARVRYGFDGEPLLGCQIAPMLGVSEARISHSLKTSRDLFRRQPLRGAVRAHLDGLRGFVGERGGLVSFEEIEAELAAALNLGALQPLAACTLLTAIEPGFAWSPALGLLGDEDKPLRQVRSIRAAARRLAWLKGRSMPLAEVLGDLRARHFYAQGSPEARGAFFVACMRTDARARTDGGLMCPLPPTPRQHSRAAPSPNPRAPAHPAGGRPR